MDWFSTPQLTAQRAVEPAGIDEGTDLVIVVLNEGACGGWARSCMGDPGVPPAAVAA